MDIKQIDINKNNIQNYLGLDIVAFQWAAAGACGEHGGIVFITKKGKVYHTNYVYPEYGISWDDLFDIFPSFERILDSIYGSRKEHLEWEYLYLGLGNSLIVHESIWNNFNLSAKTKLHEEHEAGNDEIMYNVWIKAVLSVLETDGR